MNNIEVQYQMQQNQREKQNSFKFINGVGIVRTATLRNLSENAKNFGAIAKSMM